MSHQGRVERIAGQILLRRRPDLRDLSHITEMDLRLRFCAAEPGVTFADLVLTTLPLGLIPLVVPLCPDATLGGAVAGGAGGPTSHRHGGFHDTCLEYEVITSAGQVLRCSPESDGQIFAGQHGARGAAGVLCKIKLRLQPAPRSVRLRRQRFSTASAFAEAMIAACAEADFVSGQMGPRDFMLEIGHALDGPGPLDEEVLSIGDYLLRGGPGQRPLSHVRGLRALSLLVATRSRYRFRSRDRHRGRALLAPRHLQAFQDACVRVGAGALTVVPYRHQGTLYIGCAVPAALARWVRDLGGQWLGP
jgi:FAD/FMN-containing dehydrogenase